jgi:hypothetical protein
MKIGLAYFAETKNALAYSAGKSITVKKGLAYFATESIKIKNGIAYYVGESIKMKNLLAYHAVKRPSLLGWSMNNS